LFNTKLNGRKLEFNTPLRTGGALIDGYCGKREDTECEIFLAT